AGDRHVTDHRGNGVGAVPPAGGVLDPVSLPGDGDRSVHKVPADLRKAAPVRPVSIQRRVMVAVEPFTPGVWIGSVPLLERPHRKRCGSTGIRHFRSARSESTPPSIHPIIHQTPRWHYP